MLHSAASIFLVHAVAEELTEHLLGQQPVLAVDTILHFRRLNLALNEPGVFQFFQMLRHGGFGDGQLLVDIPEVAGVALGQKVEYRYPGGMPQRLGKSGYLLLIDGVILLVLFHIVRFTFAKLRTIYQTAKHLPHLFTKINEAENAIRS